MNTNLLFKFKQKLAKLNDQLEEEKEFLTSILDTQPSLVVVLDPQGRIIKFNKACEKITNYSSAEITGNLIWDTLIPEREKEKTKKTFKELITKKITNEHKNYWQSKNGELHLISWSNTVITDKNEQVKYIIATGIDITKHKEQEDKIDYISFHDNLTDLYNRSYLEEEMKRLDTKRQLPISIIMGDANGLKLINDTYGHYVGDEMLIKISNILSKFCRKEDIISRWGGDEFVILLPQTKFKEAQSICQRINQACIQACIKNIPLSIALGAATKQEPGMKLTKILETAEERMYKNKLIQNEDRKKKILSNLLTTLKNQTDESKDHIKSVEKFSLALGIEMGLTAVELNKLSLLAVVHDIGKVTISKEILTKKINLNKKEREIINRHPEKGHQIVSSSYDLSHIANSLLHHHENWDGSGYPLGLKKENIPLLSRIIHLAISYDAMVNGRVYKPAMSKKEIVAELKKNSGTQFDPNLVRILVKLINNDTINYPISRFSRSISIINDFLN